MEYVDWTARKEQGNYDDKALYEEMMAEIYGEEVAPTNDVPVEDKQ